MTQTSSIQIDSDGDATHVTLSDGLTIRNITESRAALARIPPSQHVTIDLGQVGRLDTAGAWLLTTFQKDRQDQGSQVRIRNASVEAQSLLTTTADALPVREDVPSSPTTLKSVLETVGKATSNGVGFILALTGFLGIFLSRLARALRHPQDFRLTALVHHCQEVGLKAVPIVALMAFLIGVVLAFQGASQLRQFGAEVFVVDLIAISILRELGILLTSIIVAGRTASAFTAAIGSMKMREEIDAMRTLGLDPAMVLFVPRILALLLMLPILGLIANIAGLFGGALMAWIELGISPAMFQTRLVEGTDVNHVMVGLVKAPVFALLIGVVGCHAGMQVKSNAESLGRMTSSSVVTAIFAVIVADALFSIFFASLGI